jgi:hypothetical protein
MLTLNFHTSKMGLIAEDFLITQIRVTAFIQGIRLSYCFNKSRVNLKSPQFDLE